MLNRILNIVSIFTIVSYMAIMLSCAENTDNRSDNDAIKQKERLEEANRYLVTQEKEIINDYIRENNSVFVETGTGLRYRIIEQGDDELIKTGDIVMMGYEVGLVNGELIYSSDNEGFKVFQVGRGGVERGLEEAVLHLHNNDVAEVIIPSYLAYGLTGDGNKIPPKSILVYKLKIIDKQ